MKIKTALREFLFPPFCPGCREVFRADYGRESDLCPICRTKWEQEKMRLCPDCGRPYTECLCMPPPLEKAGAEALLKLTPYRGGGKSAADMTVLYLKTNRDRRIFKFVGGQLAALIFRYCAENRIDCREALITYAPRRISAVNLHGFDQSRELCRAVEQTAELRVVRAVGRIPFSGSAQKKQKNRIGRAANARDSFRAVKNADLNGRTVFLLDDIVTTGASMAACVKIVKKLGAVRIVCVCISCTEKSNEKSIN